MEQALRKWLERAEEIYQRAIKEWDLKAAIEAVTVVMSTEWTLARIDDGKTKMEQMIDDQNLPNKE